MPAPDDLTPQTPGEPLAAQTNEQDTAEAQAPEALPKHNGGGRFIVVGADGVRLNDFQGTKEEAQAEAQRLIDSGDLSATAAEDDESGAEAEASDTAQPQASAPVAAQKAPARLDPTTLQAPVMTSDGWLCPEAAPTAKV